MDPFIYIKNIFVIFCGNIINLINNVTNLMSWLSKVESSRYVVAQKYCHCATENYPASYNPSIINSLSPFNLRYACTDAR